MFVEAIREHQNFYGDKPHKAVGAKYEMPDNTAKVLIDAGLVKEIKADKGK
jgi:hypothetical protein